MVDWLMDRVESTVDIASAQGKRQFTTKVFQIIRQLKDPVEQEHYAQRVAERTGSSIETVKDKLQQQTTVKKRLKRVVSAEENESTREQRIREQHLLAIGAQNKEVGTQLAKLPLDVFSDEAKDLASYVQQHPGVSPTGGEYAKMLTLLFEEYYQDTEEEELVYQSQRLLSRLVRTYANMKKQMLVDEIDSADDEKQNTLLKAVKQLDDLVKQFA